VRHGVCDKCGQHTVHFGRATLYVGTHPSTNTAHAMVPGRTLPTTASSFIDAYVCTYCGYLEQYLPSAELLQFVRAYWPQVPPQVTAAPQPTAPPQL